MQETDKQEIQKMIDLAIERAMLFSTRKLGDTPTDALQLANKKYVDDRVMFGHVNADGTSTILPTGWTSSKTATGTYLITHNLNSTAYGVVATPLFASDSRMTAVVLYQNANDFTINTIFTVSTDTDNPFFFIVNV